MSSVIDHLPISENSGSPLQLKSNLKQIERRNKAKAFALILPLFIFLILVFWVPLIAMLGRSISNKEVATYLPNTVVAMKAWSVGPLPPESVYAALAADIQKASVEGTLGEVSRRLNMEIPSFRSLLGRTANAVPFDLTETKTFRATFIDIDPRWGESTYLRAIQRNADTFTDYYLLAAIDKTRNDAGVITASTDELFVKSFARTLWISLVVTIACLLLAYPLAFLLAHLPKKLSNYLMICVLLPFWTSVLVRVAAWIVLLQSGGLINRFGMALGLFEQPLQLVFNRTGVYIAMVHILLPFMILPIYSVMKNISPTYMRAAISLGSSPLRSFWKVYFPQTLAGVGAGTLLVFILSIGYYITPALLGGSDDQMISYFIAFFTNTTINWGLAAALSTLLLIATLSLYVVYSWLVGANKLKLG